MTGINTVNYCVHMLMPVSHNFIYNFNKQVGSDGNTSGFYLGGAQFECRPVHQLP
jgi:hypothetical protein